MTAPKSVVITIKVPPQVKEQLEQLAVRDDRPLSLYLKRLLTVHVSSSGRMGPS